MAINKSTKIKITSANLTFKIILLVLEVLLPFGLYWAIAAIKPCLAQFLRWDPLGCCYW